MVMKKQSKTVVINAKHAESLALAHRIKSALTDFDIPVKIFSEKSIRRIKSYRTKYLCCIDLHTYHNMTDRIVVQYARNSGTSNDLAIDIVEKLIKKHYPSQKLENNSSISQSSKFTKRITRMYQTPTVRVTMRRQSKRALRYSKFQLNQIATQIAESINAFAHVMYAFDTVAPVAPVAPVEVKHYQYTDAYVQALDDTVSQHMSKFEILNKKYQRALVFVSEYLQMHVNRVEKMMERLTTSHNNNIRD